MFKFSQAGHTRNSKQAANLAVDRLFGMQGIFLARAT
jgi:hypothetical protein